MFRILSSCCTETIPNHDVKTEVRTEPSCLCTVTTPLLGTKQQPVHSQTVPHSKTSAGSGHSRPAEERLTALFFHRTPSVMCSTPSRMVRSAGGRWRVWHRPPAGVELGSGALAAALIGVITQSAAQNIKHLSLSNRTLYCSLGM